MLARIVMAALMAVTIGTTPAAAQDDAPYKYKNQSELSNYLSNRNLNPAVRFVLANALFTVYHEVGHLLVDQLNWPIIGREEDVADNFATYTLLEGKRRSFELALKDSALGWQLTDQNRGGRRDASDYYDEHSLDLQRAYQIVCLMVGKDRSTFAITAQEWGIDRHRQHRCQDDYGQIENSISRLLAPHTGASLHADVTVEYDRSDRRVALAYKVLRDSKLLESVADDLREGYGLPNPITLHGTMCGEPNAFYDASTGEILFCYELLEDLFDIYNRHVANGGD